MESKMKTFSGKFYMFNWLRIQSYAGLVFAGLFFSLLLKLCMRKRYREFSAEYDEFVSRAKLKGLPRGCKKAFFASLLIYGSYVREFFLYDFIHLNDRGRRSFITETNRYLFYPKYNGAGKRIEMQDKYLAYQAYRKFYRREVMRIDHETTVQDIKAFFQRCTRKDGCILKPNLAGCGRGIEIVRQADHPSEQDAYSYICSKQGYVMEELVEEAGIMKELHPGSVNTVRVYACRACDGIRIFGSHLRIGVGNSIVDNAALGGVVVSITKEGYAWTSGIDEFGRQYFCHPDTQIRLAGIQLPEWKKALQLIKEAMDVIPDIRFVGWDLAYTEQGWIIIEANDNAQFYGAQLPYHKGLLHEAEQYLQGTLGTVI